MALHMPRQRPYEPGFTQARLADHKDNLTHPLLSLFPPIFEQTDFGLATRQRRRRFGFASTAGL
jgi:hypothetical protein